MVVQVPSGQFLPLAQVSVSLLAMVLDLSIGELSVLEQVSCGPRLVFGKGQTSPTGGIDVLAQMPVSQRAEFLQVLGGQRALFPQVLLGQELMLNQVLTLELGTFFSRGHGRPLSVGGLVSLYCSSVVHGVPEPAIRRRGGAISSTNVAEGLVGGDGSTDCCWQVPTAGGARHPGRCSGTGIGLVGGRETVIGATGTAGAGRGSR